MNAGDVTTETLRFAGHWLQPAGLRGRVRGAPPPAVRELAAEALWRFFSNQAAGLTPAHHQAVQQVHQALLRSARRGLVEPALISPQALLDSGRMPLVPARLQALLAHCRSDRFALDLARMATRQDLQLPSPFGDGTARCQESYEVGKGLNCLRFVDGAHCFFLMQRISSADGLYFPLAHLALSIGYFHGSHVKLLQDKLLRDFDRVVAYARGENRFAGLIASQQRPGHVYYEIWPALFQIAQDRCYADLPGVVLRHNHDFYDLPALLPGCRVRVLDSATIDAEAMRTGSYFVHAGVHRFLQTDRRYHEAADQHLVDVAAAAPTPAAVAVVDSLAGCEPLVWVGVEGQKRCWLEQTEGYAHLLNQLAQRFPRLGVVFDGWTLPFTPTAASREEAAKDRRIAEAIAARLAPGISWASVIGENGSTKIAVARHIRFFIANFASGSMVVSRFLGKPGFAHLSNALADHTLRGEIQIHPNPHVHLLPRAAVNDAPPQASVWTRVLRRVRGRPEAGPLSEAGAVSYHIDPARFWDFIAPRLDGVLANQPADQLTLFLEPSFSIHPDVRHAVKMASHGQLIEVFPTLDHPRRLADLAPLPPAFLRRHVIYGLFALGDEHALPPPSRILLWLGDPLERLRLHALQFVRNAAAAGVTTTLDAVMREGHKALDNYYTRLLSGLDPAFGQCSTAMLDTALANLDRSVCFVGFNQQQAASFDRLCRLMDWDRDLFTVPLPDEHEAARHSGELAGFDDKAAEDRVRFDRALFDAAWARWADRSGAAA